METQPIGWKPSLIVIVSFAISACGGGGGTGNNNGGNDPGPVDPPSTALSIDAQNAPAVLQHLGDLTDALFELAITAGEKTLTLVERGDTYVDDCRNGRGDITWTLQDGDGDGQLSVGDSVTIAYDECEEFRSGSIVTGSLEVDVLELDTGSGVRLRASITTVGAFSNLRLGGSNLIGSIEIYVFESGATEVLQLSIPPGAQMAHRYTPVGESVETTETVTRLQASRTIRFDAGRELRYDITWDIDVGSTALSGNLLCFTTPSLEGKYGDDPDAGEAICATADDSALRISPAAIPGSFELAVDVEGDGTFEVVPNFQLVSDSWSSYGFVYLFDRAIFADPGQSGGPVQLPTVTTTRYTGDIRAASYDPVSDRLIIGTADQLLYLDADSFSPLGAVDLPYQPQSVAVSDDGSTIWIGYVDMPVLQALSTIDNSLGPEISLSSPPPAVDPAPADARFLAVAPGLSNRVVASAELRGLVAVENGVALPDAVQLGTHTRPTFLDTQTLAMGLQRFPEFDALSIISLDVSTGLSVAKTLPAYLDGESRQLASDGQLVYSGTGRIYDLATDAIKGRIPRALELQTYDVIFNPDRSEMYALTNGLFVFSPDPLRLKSAYKPDEVVSGIHKGFFASDDSVYIATRDMIVRFARADLVDTLPTSPCNLFDLSNLVLPTLLLQLRCDVTDAVYDAARNDIVLATKGNGVQQGGLVLFVEPSTAAIIEQVTLPALPGDIELSSDGLYLYVSMAEGTEIVVVDLNSRSLIEPIDLGLQEDVSGSGVGPYIANRAAVSEMDSANLVAATMGNDLLFFQNRMRATDVDAADDAVGSLFLSSDGASALALTPTESSIFDVSSSGVTKSEVLGTLLPENSAAQQGNEVFAVDGSVYNFDDGTVTSDCTAESGGIFGNAVAPNADGMSVYYVRGDSSGYLVDVCDRATGVMTAQPLVNINNDASSYLLAAFSIANGLFVIVHTQGILIMDEPGQSQ